MNPRLHLQPEGFIMRALPKHLGEPMTTLRCSRADDGAFALDASLSLLEAVGMQRVGECLEQRVQQLSEGIARLPGATLHSPLAAQRRAGILNFSLAGWNNAALYQRLREDQVICAQRGLGVRLSPHFYTSQRVIEETLNLLAQLAKG